MQVAALRALTARPADRKKYFGNRPWARDASWELGWDFIGIGKNVEPTKRFDDFLESESLVKILNLPPSYKCL